MANTITTYVTSSTNSVIDAVVTLTSNSPSPNPSVLVYADIGQVYAQIGVNQDLFTIIYLLLQKSSRSAANQYVYSFNLRLAGRSTALANLFVGATGPTGASQSGPIGPTGPTGIGPEGPTGPQGIPGSGFSFILPINGSYAPVVNDLVAVNSSGEAILADASSIVSMPAVGFVTSIDLGTMEVTCASTGNIAGLSGLTTGTNYFLGTSGGLQTVPSTGAGAQFIGKALSTTTLLANVSSSVVYF